MNVLIAYHGMARRSPCFVPSWDKISLPPQVNNVKGHSVCVDDIHGHFRATNLDSVCTIIIKNLGHDVYGGLGTRTVASRKPAGGRLSA